MNLEAKNKWVEALRSGRYEQTKEQLYDSNKGYCCLGVLTDLYLKEFKCPIVNDYEHTILVHSDGDLNEMPDKEVLSWAELSLNDASDLTNMNDGGDDFVKIGNYIDENL